MQQGESDVLADVIDYSKNKLAPLRTDPSFRDHWFDDVKVGFDTLWCAVARLELMLHCGKTSEEVGGPVLVTRADADAIAGELRKECPDFGGGQYQTVFLIKKPPPGAPPFGTR
jgi:hypothetical protein